MEALTMKARNTNRNEMEKALAVVNKKYKGNIQWKRFEDGKTINFTLTVKSSKGPGGRIGFTGRRVAAACWHVHGDFFDALFGINPAAVIVSMGERISINGGNWQDKNIGSQMNPMYYSEACECNRIIVE
jgi:ABC-type taurine transport system substrate-binding protein